MNINLDDKKIKKIVYAIDDVSEMDILFENGEIVSLNKRYKSAMKPDTFLSSMINSSRKLGKAIIERNKKYGQEPTKEDINQKNKNTIQNFITAKKLIEMEKDGKIDEIAKAHNKYGIDDMKYSNTTSHKEYLEKCEQESNNGEESMKKFDDGLDKMNMYDNIKPILDKLEEENGVKKEQPKLKKVFLRELEETSSKDIGESHKCTKDCENCDEQCCHKNVDEIKIQERLDESEKGMDLLTTSHDKDDWRTNKTLDDLMHKCEKEHLLTLTIKDPSIYKIMRDVSLKLIDMGKSEMETKILFELDRIGFYELDEEKRCELELVYIERAIKNINEGNTKR